MLKPQSHNAHFKQLRPFPLYRLPSLLKRSLSIAENQQPVTDTSTNTESSNELSPKFKFNLNDHLNDTHLLLDLLPNVRHSQLAWVTSRLLCISASYIAGMAFYDFIASLLSLSHHQMRVYDVLSSQSAHTHNTNKLVNAWAVTVVLAAIVVVVVNYVVRLSERKFAWQLHREIQQVQRIESQMLHHTHSQLPVTVAVHGNGNDHSGGNSVSEEQLVEQQKRETRQREQQSIIDRHPMLAARIKADEDKRAVTRALIHHSNLSDDDDGDGEDDANDSGEALAAAVEAGLTPRQIYRRAVSNDRYRRATDPVTRTRPLTLFLYRLADMACYYLIFVAVYAFQNTLQLSIPTDTVQWSWTYFVALSILAFAIIGWLERRSERINGLLVKHQQLSSSSPLTPKAAALTLPSYASISDLPVSTHSCTDTANDIKLRKLKIKQASSRKLSMYVSSCLAYLLAYAAWATMQASARAVIPDELAPVMTSRIYLWVSAIVVLLISGLLIVAFNMRVRTSLIGDANSAPQSSLTKPLDVSTTLLKKLCCSFLINRLVSPSQTGTDTDKLEVRVDILEGSVTSFYQSLVTESLSYIIALSLGAALTASLPAAPSDAATYNYPVQPSSLSITLYAVSCSLVLAALTLWLDRYVRTMERKSRERTKRLIDAHSKAVLAQSLTANTIASNVMVSPLPHPGIRGLSSATVSDREKFRVDTAETALYILHKQQQYERVLKVRESEEEEWKRRQEKRRLRTNSNSFLLSSSPITPAVSQPALGQPPFLALGQSQYSQSQPTSPSPLTSIAVRQPTECSPLLSPVNPTVNTSLPGSLDSTHRAVLTLTFLEQYYTALATTLTQGFALLVAYSWTGVFALVLYPALRRWNVLWLVDDVYIKTAWSVATFAFYFLCILAAAKVFHREECFEL